MRAWLGWSIVLGFALGGFFDGILLHQILQWHHLLSLVPGVNTLRGQVLWDGYFHALMYVVAVLGLWGLWRAREQLQGRSALRLPGSILVGFGLWHVVDGVLSHWVLGIHRIRLDSPDPLLWDLIWLVGFGLLPAAAGCWLLRRRQPPAGGLRGSTMAFLLVGLLTAGMAAWSLRTPADQPFTTVVFAPGVEPAEAMNAIVAADARLVWSDPAMAVVVLEMSAENRLGFYRKGALLVSGSAFSAGCISWSKGLA